MKTVKFVEGSKAKEKFERTMNRLFQAKKIKFSQVIKRKAEKGKD